MLNKEYHATNFELELNHIIVLPKGSFVRAKQGNHFSDGFVTSFFIKEGL